MVTLLAVPVWSLNVGIIKIMGGFCVFVFLSLHYFLNFHVLVLKS